MRQYPGSGYSDNALWQAGRLLLDAFARSGQTADRESGVRLLKKLAAESGFDARGDRIEVSHGS